MCRSCVPRSVNLRRHVITVLSTLTPGGDREYRVKEHLDCGHAFSYYHEEEDGPLRTYVHDVDRLVARFEGAMLFDDEGAAWAEAHHQKEEIFQQNDRPHNRRTECSVQCANVDKTWDELVVEAEAIRKRRTRCKHNNLGFGKPYVYIEHWSEDRVVHYLLGWGWHSEEANVVRERLGPTWYSRDYRSWLYRDRLRLARVTNGMEMAAFDEAKEGGCCQFFEEELVAHLPDGTQSRIRIGFNHGH